jgi:hypothetical protein
MQARAAMRGRADVALAAAWLWMVVTAGLGCDRSRCEAQVCERGGECRQGDGRLGLCEPANSCCAVSATDDDCEGKKCAPGSTCQLWQNRLYRCIYRQCSARATDQFCNLPGGKLGICCQGACANIDTLTDPMNCLSCGALCPGPSPTCSNGCLVPCCAPDLMPNGCLDCPAGYSCSSGACAPTTCDGQPDGVFCAIPPGVQFRTYCIAGVCETP